MRIDALSIHNFRGIRKAEISDLASESLVTLSGRNGSGKSLILEAIGVLWRADRLPAGLQAQWLLGSWGDELTIEMTLSLAIEERQALEAAQVTLGGPEGAAPENCSLKLRLNQQSGGGLEVDPWVALLRRPEFWQQHPFGQLDHLPADRTTGRGEAAQVNPALLHDDQREAFRQQIVGSYSQQRQVTNISGVAPLLATADYMDLLAGREGREPSGDFEAIVGPFESATGKSIQRPSADPSSPHGAVIQVETPAETSHALDQLSSGEQEVLSLSFFVRRLRARGGILLIDEPELHLHPALQQSLFAQLAGVADRAQVWIVTHSPRLVTSAPLGAILHMRGPTAVDQNQLRRASGESDRTKILDDLGIHPIEVLQSQFIIVVEGETDRQRLSALLPVELGPAVLTVAGDGPSVERVAHSLAAEGEIPCIAIRDRDLMQQDEVDEKLTSVPTLFVWRNRELENELLHIPLLVETLQRAGADVDVESVTIRLKEIAGGQKQDIAVQLVEAALVERVEANVEGTTQFERLASYIQEQRRIADEKLEIFDTVKAEVGDELDSRWDSDFLTLMDGKRSLGEFSSTTPFRNTAALTNAIITTLRDRPDLIPPGLAELRNRLTELAIATRAEVAPSDD